LNKIVDARVTGGLPYLLVLSFVGCFKNVFPDFPHKKSIIQPYISFLHLNIKKEAKVWVTQKNIGEDEKLAQKKEELEKEIKENNF
jgi:hypothetical protein